MGFFHSGGWWGILRRRNVPRRLLPVFVRYVLSDVVYESFKGSVPERQPYREGSDNKQNAHDDETKLTSVRALAAGSTQLVQSSCFS